MLYYAGCWHRFCFLIKYINYEILLQRITSLCPTREWFMLQLTGELCGVHLQLIKRGGAGVDRQALLASTRDHPMPKLDGRTCSSQSPRPSRKVFVSWMCCLCGLPLQGRCLWYLGPELANNELSVFVLTWKATLLPPLLQSSWHECSLLQEALIDSSRCSENQPIMWLIWPLTRFHSYVRLCGLSSKQ